MERYNFLNVEKKWRKNVSANSVKNNNSKTKSYNMNNTHNDNKKE